MRLPVEKSLPLAALTILAACGGGGGGGLQSASAAAQGSYGPAADYPVLVGAAYEVNGTTFTPADTMNYDVVGRASVGSDGGNSISAAHHTLPLPSYVEVTSLDTGKTILVRVERRGPMNGTNVIELSPGAAAQLGLSGPNSPVRVRRVNPVEPERALLRTGEAAPARMDTPKSLLGVLQRKLDQQEGVTRPVPDPATQVAPTPEPTPVPKPKGKTPKPAMAPSPAPTPAPTPSPASAARGNFVVQVGAFSNQANARAAAGKTGGSLVQAGNLWRVRLGPFATEAQAAAALAKAKAAGYTDARIQRVD